MRHFPQNELHNSILTVQPKGSKVQLMETVKVTEETRETVRNLSAQSGIKMYKIFEQAVALWKAKYGQQSTGTQKGRSSVSR